MAPHNSGSNHDSSLEECSSRADGSPHYMPSPSRTMSPDRPLYRSPCQSSGGAGPASNGLSPHHLSSPHGMQSPHWSGHSPLRPPMREDLNQSFCSVSASSPIRRIDLDSSREEEAPESAWPGPRDPESSGSTTSPLVAGSSTCRTVSPQPSSSHRSPQRDWVNRYSPHAVDSSVRTDTPSCGADSRAAAEPATSTPDSGQSAALVTCQASNTDSEVHTTHSVDSQPRPSVELGSVDGPLATSERRDSPGSVAPSQPMATSPRSSERQPCDTSPSPNPSPSPNVAAPSKHSPSSSSSSTTAAGHSNSAEPQPDSPGPSRQSEQPSVAPSDMSPCRGPDNEPSSDSSQNDICQPSTEGIEEPSRTDSSEAAVANRSETDDEAGGAVQPSSAVCVAQPGTAEEPSTSDAIHTGQPQASTSSEVVPSSPDGTQASPDVSVSESQAEPMEVGGSTSQRPEAGRHMLERSLEEGEISEEVGELASSSGSPREQPSATQPLSGDCSSSSSVVRALPPDNAVSCSTEVSAGPQPGHSEEGMVDSVGQSGSAADVSEHEEEMEEGEIASDEDDDDDIIIRPPSPPGSPPADQPDMEPSSSSCVQHRPPSPRSSPDAGCHDSSSEAIRATSSMPEHSSLQSRFATSSQADFSLSDAPRASSSQSESDIPRASSSQCFGDGPQASSSMPEPSAERPADLISSSSPGCTVSSAGGADSTWHAGLDTRITSSTWMETNSEARASHITSNSMPGEPEPSSAVINDADPRRRVESSGQHRPPSPETLGMGSMSLCNSSCGGDGKAGNGPQPSTSASNIPACKKKVRMEITRS